LDSLHRRNFKISLAYKGNARATLSSAETRGSRLLADERTKLKTI